MRYLSIFQIILGLAIVIFSWILAGVKAHIYTHLDPIMNGDIPIIFSDAQPPNSILEFILLGLSVAVFICGWCQRKGHIKGSILQIIGGAIIIVIYLILGIRAANLNAGEVSGIYYVAFLSLALGLGVSIIGLIQFIHYRSQITNPEKIT